MAAPFARLIVRRRRSASRRSFSRRLALWAQSMGMRRKVVIRPVMGALMAAWAAGAVSEALAAPPAATALPKPLTGATQVKIRGKVFNTSWQPYATKPSVMGEIKTDSSGKVSQVLTQYDKRAVYNWASFDIGQDATFEIDMRAGNQSAALNRVVNSLAPSQIFGRLKSNGEVFIINRNGVLFGKGAQVNVQGLVASMLDIDDQVFLNGLNTIDTTDPTFAWDSEDGMATYDSEKNYVKVDAGAQITTPAGGRVILLAPTSVTNAGEISTPGGQTALVSGEKVYVKTPATVPIYASEINDKIPALRGLLFEVEGRGEATNLGRILTERGNTTLMAHTVRQGGAIKATTSVAENGSVFLLARSGASADTTAGQPQILGTTGGELTLSAGSTIEIAPDNSLPVSNSVAMTASRIELSGQTIDIGENARIRAPGAVVNIRATEGLPDYAGAGSKSDPYRDIKAPTAARIVMRQGASIDVSGTQDTQASVARHFVTTEFLRNADLSGTPFLKDGALLNSKVTYDTRSAPTVLESTSHQGYLNSIQTTAGERMAQGGSVTMASTGAVLMQSGASVNVSGGKVTFTDAKVAPTRLQGADGKTYTLNTARKDVQITAVSGQQATDLTRYGQRVSNEAASSYTERGYVQGGSGGSFNVQAPVTVLDGTVSARVENGVRQQSGLDARARQASIRLGVSTGGNMLGGVTLLKALTSSQPASLWSDPLKAALPTRSTVSAAMLNGSGAGQIAVTTEGGLTLADGANLSLQAGGALGLKASGAGGIVLGGSIRGAGASVNIVTTQGSIADVAAGGITLKAGQSIDVSGNVVNQRLDASAPAPAAAGGLVALRSAAGLDMQTGTSIDVSGGATVSSAGKITGTRAGGIALEANNDVPDAKSFKPVNLSHTALSGYALVGSSKSALGDVGDNLSGKLSLKVGEVSVVGQQTVPTSLSVGAAPDSLILGDAFFNQGGFSQFDIEGARRLSVASDAVIRPLPQQWVAQGSLLRAPSGSRLRDHVQSIVAPTDARPTVSVSLRSRGVFNNDGYTDSPDANGNLRVARGAVIDAGLRGKVLLEGGRSLVVGGSVKAAGGSITTDLVGRDTSSDDGRKFSGTYRFEAGSELDVSGTRVLSSTAPAGRLDGKVLDGGSIDLKLSSDAAVKTAIAIEGSKVLISEGQTQTLAAASLKADGAQGLLDTRQINAQGVSELRREVAASRGGSISVVASRAGALLAGDMSAKAGGVQAEGGRFNLAVTANSATLPGTGVIALQNGSVTDTSPTLNRVKLSTQGLQQGGFDSVSLKASHGVEASGNVSLAVRRDLTLLTPVISAGQGSSMQLSAGSRLAWEGNVTASTAPQGGGGSLTLKGDLVDVMGDVHTGQAASLAMKAGSLLRFGSSRDTGSLRTVADVQLTAPQVTVSTAKQFTLDASGHTVKSDGGQPGVAKPLSAGASLTIRAKEIHHDGVFQLPFGHVTLAAEKVVLGARSVTSVSGQGVSMPFGMTSEGGTTWTANGKKLDVTPDGQVPDKRITLNAGAGEVVLEAGSTVDVSAGGQLLGWEFVPGPGGAKDIFQGTYESGVFAIVPTIQGAAPLDNEILAAAGITDLASYQGLNRQITFGEGGPVPAGTYAILPARYALLQGGYLIKTNSTTPMDLGAAIRRSDGSSLVGAMVSARGEGQVTPRSATFDVLTREAALRYSEIRETKLDDFLSARASRLQVTAPRMARDAGSVDLIADKMRLQGSMQFHRQPQGRGGELNISADNIWLGAGDVPADALHLDVAQLNATKVDSLLLGGLRQDRASDGTRQVETRATQVTLGAMAGDGLSLDDVVIVAKDKLDVQTGATIQTKPNSQGTSAERLQVLGDGALVRVSADEAASTVRIGTDAQPLTRTQGDVAVAKDARLSGGAVTIEATHSTLIDDSAQISARQLTLGAARMAVGDRAAALAAPGTLVIGEQLAARLAQAQRATLRSFDGIDVMGQGTLGGATQQNLSIDTHEIRLAALNDGASSGRIEAGSVALLNSSGQTGIAGSGSGNLTIVAHGANAGSGADGHVTFRDGVTTVSGDADTVIEARSGVVFQSRREAVIDEVSGQALTSRAVQSGMNTGGTLSVQAPLITTGAGAMGTLSAAEGGLTLHAAALPAGTTAPAPELGGTLSLSGQHIDHAGVIDLPSGAVNLTATQGDVRFRDGAITRVDGTIWEVDGQKVATAGGSVKAVAKLGGIQIDQGALISASAPAGVKGAQAGDITLTAPHGQVTLDGTVRALSDANQKGGSFKLDALYAPTLTQITTMLAKSAENMLDASKTDGSLRGNMTGAFHIQQRDGDIVVDGGTAVRAKDMKLVADAGRIDVHGTLDASGQEAGQIALMASGRTQDDGSVVGGVTVAQGGILNASATGQGQSGGAITLATTQGEVTVQAGSLLDLSGGQGGQGGELTLRASQTDTAGEADGEVKIAALQGQIQGARKVTVQAVRTRDVDALDTSLLKDIKQATQAFQNLAMNQGTLARILNGRFGADTHASLMPAWVLQSTSDLSLDAAWNLDDFGVITEGNRYRAAYLGGNLLDLTFRTAGQLSLHAGLSSGFGGKTSMPGTLRTRKADADKDAKDAAAIAPAGLIVNDSGASFNLVAGADLGSADHMATSLDARDTGHVVIGNGDGSDVIVRTTTGDIRIAAAGNVQFTDERAAVYTTGRLTTSDETPDVAGFGTRVPHTGTLNKQKPILTDGGRITLQAGGSITLDNSLDAVSPSLSDWFVAREGKPDGSLSSAWWSRYDLFKQGVATFGGGDITATAGQDVRNLAFVAAGSGYQSTTDGAWRQWGGGSVAVKADGAIAGVTVQASGAHADIAAGTDIATTAQRGGMQLFFQDTDVNVRARQQLDVGRIAAVGATVGDGLSVLGLSTGSTLSMQSVAGDVQVQAALPNGAQTTDYADIWADDSRVTAPLGSIGVNFLVQAPVGAADLTMLARHDLRIDNMQVYAHAPWAGDIGLSRSNPNLNTSNAGIADAVFDSRTPALEHDQVRNPVRLVAQEGDVQLNVGPTGGVANPVRILAGRDVNITRLYVQHQTPQELSVIRAGRDIRLTGSDDAVIPDLSIHGPGNLMLIAGRDADLASTTGLQAFGNRQNSLLPDRSANITLAVGADPLGCDYTQAQQQYFHLLGGAGVAEWSSDLYAQLVASRAGQGIPGLGSDVALNFAQLGFEQQLAAARAIVGDAAYQQAVLAHIQGRSANSGLKLEQALSEVGALPQRERGVLIGKVLAGAWYEALSAQPGDVLTATVSAMSARRGRLYEQGLIDFVAARTGRVVTSITDALAAFNDDAQVAPEARMLFTHAVLRNEVSQAGRTASKITDSEEAKFDAYQRGFNAIETVFPGSKPASRIEMGASNIKTLQDSDITLMVPHGGINVGRLTSEASDAAKLGIMTTAGGDITGIAQGNIEVNQSRIFTVGRGNMLLWSSFGDIDAGKGAKTVTGSPPPIYKIVDGKVQVDNSGSYTGSGIAALNEGSRLELYAPRGAINAGEAGIRAKGELSIGAKVIIGGNDIQIAGGGNLAPPPVTGNAATSIGTAGQAATAAGPEAAEGPGTRDKASKRQLMLELLGFGTGSDDEDEDRKKKRNNGQ